MSEHVCKPSCHNPCLLEKTPKRYCPDPHTRFKCPYCNELARLRDADVVVDSYLNVCHLSCFEKEVRPNVNLGRFAHAR